MPRKRVDYKIPYIKVQDPKHGQPVGSVPYQITRYEMRNPKWADKYEWKDNEPFDACLKFVKLGYGAKSLWVSTDTGAEFYLSQSALAEVLRKKSIIYGCVLGTWKFKKHGNSHSIVLLS
jgi:hypothetical protein